jgi:predicted transglutaminase-like cysteine proteinase
MVRIVLSSLLGCAALVGASGQASALGILPLFTIAPLPMAACAQGQLPNAATPSPVPVGGAFARPAGSPSMAGSKSAAILGGVSALDRIRMEQALSVPSQQSGPTYLVRAAQTVGQTGSDLAPGSGPMPCSRFALPSVPAFAAAPSTARPLSGGDDFLQTRRLSVSRTAFDRQWNRVSRDTLSRRQVSGNAVLRGYLGARASEDMLSSVNAWANARIRFVEDKQLFGAADHWAGARTTLKLGAGDCEDIAITKLQLLAAMGVPRSDMYLTIARDLARRADHAVLVVRLDGRYWMLDNATDRLLDAGASYDYQPVLSFSEDRKWLHGAVLAANY